MKWQNKRHEFDEVASKIPENFRKEIYVFGAGKIGEKIASYLDRFGLLGGFIDNDKKKQKTVLINKPILLLEEYLSERDSVAIIIAVSERYANDIEQQLIDANLKQGKDYFVYDEFMDSLFPVITTYFLNKSYMNLAQITLTERCSLKCKKCAHACYNVDNTADDMLLQEAYRSADSFFAKVDFICEFVLIGGEPFLYKNLADVITYVGEKYREQMDIYSITTNGTIVPSKDVLEACRKYRIFMRISNYSSAIPRLKESHRRLISALDEYEIEYRLAPEEGKWIDYGFEYLNRKVREEELIQIFDNCHTPCREVRGNKLYFCVMARSVSDNLHLNEGKDDYLDLDKLVGEDYRKELLEFNMGYSEKGYMDMCRRCHGMDAVKYPIPVAEQM